MLNINRVLHFFLFIALFVMGACNLKQQSIEEMTFKAKRAAVIEQYPKIPHDEILHQITGTRLYTDLVEMYKADLTNLKAATEADNVKLIVAVVTSRVGKSGAPENSYGIPYILNICDNLNVEYYNIADKIAAGDISEIALVPDESIWTKYGCAFLADQFAAIITNFSNYRSGLSIPEASRPETFGDLPPNISEVVKDEGMPMPYKLKTNKQGLRMDYDITFPKSRQRVVFLGDAKVLCPYLDNEFIFTNLLQRRFPDKEIINAGGANYTMDDYQTLYKEKCRFAEPDIVIVCTDGGDILDEYFTQRNRYSRSKRIYTPRKTEKDFYLALYGTE